MLTGIVGAEDGLVAVRECDYLRKFTLVLAASPVGETRTGAVLGAVVSYVSS